MFDTVIRSGRVIDGTGAPARLEDVGITDGRIAAIGPSLGSARRTIDADGLVVTPGFVDLHTHLDVQPFWDPSMSPSSLHGVTTVIGGNCGFSVAPLQPDQAEFTMQMLARVEGMPLSTLESSVPWSWSTTAEFLDVLEGRVAVNAGFMVGHSALRRSVMGTEGSERAASEDEITRMRELLAEGVRAGGFGFSSSWGTSHFDAAGAPVPSRCASEDELVALAGVCSEFEGTSIEFIPGAGVGPFAEADTGVMIRMSKAAGRPLNWNVLSVTTDSLAISEQKVSVGPLARSHGARIVGLIMARNPGTRYSFLSGMGLDGLYGWGPAMTLPLAEKLRVLRDPIERKTLHDLALQPSPVLHHADWANKRIVQVFRDDLKRYEGRTVRDIAAEEGKDPFDALVDLACADDLRTSFVNKPRPDTEADWRARARFFTTPDVVIGASDAGAHLDMVATFDYPSVVLQEVVRERELLTLEHAVYLLTDVPARLYGLRDRGRLEVGAAADVLVLDPDTVGTETAKLRDDLPGGAWRLYAEAVGYHRVIVNGTVIAEDGRHTGAAPGRVLRAGQDSATPPLA